VDEVSILVRRNTASLGIWFLALRQQNSQNAHKECWGTGGCLNTKEWCKQCWLHGNIKGANQSAYKVAGSWGRRELTGVVTGSTSHHWTESSQSVIHIIHYTINVAHTLQRAMW